jgi:uncharacterized membrane protein
MSSVLLLIGVLHGVFSVLVYSTLPSKIPIHFNAGGHPDAFAEGKSLSWFTLFFVSAGMAVLFYLIVATMHRMPLKYISIPRRDEFIALPEERRVRVLGVVAFHMLVLGAICMIIFLGIHVITALVAHKIMDGLPVLFTASTLIATLAETAIMVWSIYRAVNREVDANARG